MGHYAKVRDEVVLDIIVAEADFFTDFIALVGTSLQYV